MESVASGGSNPSGPTTVRITKIRKPELSEELAEVVGAFIGDGSMPLTNTNDYVIYISGNLQKDYQYLGYLKGLFKKLFELDTNFTTYPTTNTMWIKYCSINLCEFFIETFGFSYGPKGHIDIPDTIKSDLRLAKACIKGIFDTDGCVTVQRDGKYRYPLVKITTTSPPLARNLKELLLAMGLRPFICDKCSKNTPCYDVVVKGVEQVQRFSEVIGSNNPRNINRLAEILS